GAGEARGRREKGGEGKEGGPAAAGERTGPPPGRRKGRRAGTPPISEPPRPRPIVAYHGIGSGPGRASRASPPTTKPHTTRIRMKASIRCLRSSLPAASARTGSAAGP